MPSIFSGPSVSISHRLVIFFAVVLLATTPRLFAQEVSYVVQGSYNEVQVIPTGQPIVIDSSESSTGFSTATTVVQGVPIGVVEESNNLTYPTVQGGFQYELPQPSQSTWHSESTFNDPSIVYEQSSIQYEAQYEGTSQAGVVMEHDMSSNPNVLYSNDWGYEGPGDMKTHLWEGHSDDLQRNGISHAKLMAMPMPLVQKWHNFFHGSEGSPEGQH